MKTADVRSAFLKFFEGRQHRVVPSDSLIPSTDPSLLLTSAGMVQFKPIFQNPASSPFKRAASCQKCLRTSDIDRVGATLRHLTFFEMLGNFSFGDYFKKESIAWGWEFLTKEIRLAPDRMVVSVHKNDDEAYAIWESQGISKSRIYRLGDDTNFWTMGPTGPCGPCSEILWDRGAEWSCGKKDCGPACDCDRYLEIWNHVFTQFDRSADGQLTPLPSKNIDTGMGLERLVLLHQKTSSPFGTDGFQKIYEALGQIHPFKGVIPKEPSTPAEARKHNPLLIYFRRIADHSRAVTFMISDGILPSNEGRGYVLRRLLRQAVRAGKPLGLHEPFLFQLTDTVIDEMKTAYPELLQRRETIASVVKMEEEKFLQTLDTGTELLKNLVGEAKKKKMHTLPGDQLFRLYDTYGFPFELTKEMAQDAGLSVDEAGYKAAQEQASEMARQAWKGSGAQDVGRYRSWKEALQITSAFRGYDAMELKTHLPGSFYARDGERWTEVRELRAGQEGEVALAETPFYPEGGGQVGDRGQMETADGKAEILDTQSPVEGLIVHRVRVLNGSLKAGAAATAAVDPVSREATMRHHTATHLLHKALRDLLGAHVTQAGSLVAPDRLRFDFNHSAPLTPEERQKIEDIVNAQILNDIPVRACHMTKDQAQKVGAMMLFGEKYGADVRAVMVSRHDCSRAQEAWSLELCGGTHVHATGQIGLFKITNQSSVSAGVRRLEAVAGRAALEAVRRMERRLSTLAESLKTTPEELPARVERLLARENQLDKELQRHKTGALREQYEEIAKTASSVGGIQVISRRLEGGDEKQLRDIADRLKNDGRAEVVVLAAVHDGKVSFVVSVRKETVNRGVQAGQLAKEFAALVEGSAGGRPDFAQGGGKNPEALAHALEEVVPMIKKMTVKTPHKP